MITLGAYLRENEERIKEEIGLKGDITDANYAKRERQVYIQYQSFLQKVKVLDPACGSGAFLVYVFDYLLAENLRVGAILGDLFSSEEYVRDILRNNIYGVDLNEESVEITKLSLWLKTAQKNKQLTTLDENIKCGNSLIDDPEVAGKKAFNWQEEFPEVFVRGGFDVVVGNPPYVATKQIPGNNRNYYWKRHADILFSEMDLYEIFTYTMLSQALKKDGYLGFITPNSYYTNTSFQHYRRYLLEQSQIKSIVDFPYRFFPFSDVNTETAIIILQKTVPSSNNVSLQTIDKKRTSSSRAIMSSTLKSETKVRQFDILSTYNGKIIIDQSPIVTKMLEIEGKFGDRLELHKGWMSVPEETEHNGKIFNSGVFNKEQVQQFQLQDICKRYLEGRDIHRYYHDEPDKFVNIKGMDKKTLSWHFKEKIILQRIVGQNKNKIFATFDSSNFIIFPSANLLNCIANESPKKYLAILNSTLVGYFYNQYFGESNTNITKVALEGIPLPIINAHIGAELESHTECILSGVDALNKATNQFQTVLNSEFGFEKWPTKLKEWWTLDFASFIVHSKMKMTLSQKDELFHLFGKYQPQLSALDVEIKSLDRRIDQLVYRLYNLTPEEIALVEKTTNL